MKKIRFKNMKPTDFNNFFKLVQDDEVMEIHLWQRFE